MGAIVLGMDSILHPPFIPHALFGGAYWAALCSVALAEEAAEWMRSRGALPTRRLVDLDAPFLAIPRQQPLQ